MTESWVISVHFLLFLFFPFFLALLLHLIQNLGFSHAEQIEDPVYSHANSECG